MVITRSQTRIICDRCALGVLCLQDMLHQNNALVLDNLPNGELEAIPRLLCFICLSVANSGFRQDNVIEDELVLSLFDDFEEEEEDAIVGLGFCFPLMFHTVLRSYRRRVTETFPQDVLQYYCNGEYDEMIFLHLGFRIREGGDTTFFDYSGFAAGTSDHSSHDQSEHEYE